MSLVANNSSQALAQTHTLHAQSAFKNVYKGTYTTGPRATHPCAIKTFKYTSSTFDPIYTELRMVKTAAHIIDAFNLQDTGLKVWINQPQVWESVTNTTGRQILVEPFIDNFMKYNSNSGWVSRLESRVNAVLQALSHFSYHASSGKVLLCDLQGGAVEKGVVLTDPVIMSKKKEYGPTDLGQKGIETFFSRHKCTAYCKAKWLKPVGVEKKEKGVAVNEGTSLSNMDTLVHVDEPVQSSSWSISQQTNLDPDLFSLKSAMAFLR